MGVLQPHVVEVNQESELYKRKKQRKDSQPKINEIISDASKEFGFITDHLCYYNSKTFGFKKHTSSYEKFETHLTKSSNRNGIHTFKKNSKLHKEISEKLKEIEAITNLDSPWDLHDAFGLNNAKASQWIKDRFFVEIKDEGKVSKETGELIEYKEYLNLVAGHMK